jgi:hypothetical protein
MHPAFFDRVETIVLRDPLSELLGALEGGRMELRYLDVVHLAGHSCPTVAGAFLMAARGLAALYGDEVPVRGDIEVALEHPQTLGVTGVIGNVLGFLTGAAAEGGFHGLGGQFARQGLLSYEQPLDGLVRLTRRDTRDRVTVRYDPTHIKPDPAMAGLLDKCLRDQATAGERKRFARLFQARVEAILCDHADDPHLVVVEPCAAEA